MAASGESMTIPSENPKSCRYFNRKVSQDIIQKKKKMKGWKEMRLDAKSKYSSVSDREQHRTPDAVKFCFAQTQHASFHGLIPPSPHAKFQASFSLFAIQAACARYTTLSESQSTSKDSMAALPLATAEVCDANPHLILNGELHSLQPIFQVYGRRQVFSGPVVTLKVFEDNVLVRKLLEEKGHGRVLVVDGGGSMSHAILGGNLVQRAQNNGWAGIVVNDCIRDVNEINGCDIGVRALNSHPMKHDKKGMGEEHVPVNIAGSRMCDGEWLYADIDGILVSRTELTV